jgi:hypothetical protein
MTRVRSQERHRSSRKSTDENDHSQTGQGEEIATPPAQHIHPKRERPEDFTEMNPSSTGHGRQNPSVNFKKEPDSEEEDKEEEDRRRRKRRRRRRRRSIKHHLPMSLACRIRSYT